MISFEEKFLIKVLFSQKINLNDFNKINFESLIKIASSHLILPSLYSNLKKRKFLQYIPTDLKEYLQNIYEINYNRNLNILQEAKHLSRLLKDQKINFSFIKGIYYLRMGIYLDKGERMIGDIDMIVDKKHLTKAIKVLNDYGYKNEYNFIKWKKRHLPGFKKSGGIANVELHTEFLLPKGRRYFNNEIFFKNFKKKISKIHLFLICLYSYQINDYAYLKASYSYRNILDLFKIEKLKGVENFDFKNKYIKRVFIQFNILNISKCEINLNLYDKIFLSRFYLKKKLKLYNFFDRQICYLIHIFPIRLVQLNEYISNPEYRQFLKKTGKFNKIS